MKKTIIIAVLGLGLMSGCASTPEPAPEPVETVLEEQNTGESNRAALRREVKECVLDFVDHSGAHVLDATEACLHIFGLDDPQQQRIKEL